MTRDATTAPIECTAAPPGAVDTDVLIVPWFEGEAPQGVPGLDAALGGDLARALESREFTGRPYESFLATVVDPSWKPRRVAFVGTGGSDAFSGDLARKVAGASGLSMKGKRVRRAAFLVRAGDASRIDPAELGQAVAEGLTLAEFNTGQYKTGDSPPGTAPSWTIVASGVPDGRASAFSDAVRRGRLLGECSNLSRVGTDYAANAASGDAILNGSGDGEWTAMNYIHWMDWAAFCDWAALRPMTELEFEKGARGPAPAVVAEYAWGTTGTTAAVSVLLTAAETVFGSGNGLANINAAGVAGPVRSGFAATSSTSSNRVTSGGSYYGAMDMSGNLYELTVAIGNSTGRAFKGTHGDGNLTTTASYEWQRYECGLAGAGCGQHRPTTGAIDRSDVERGHRKQHTSSEHRQRGGAHLEAVRHAPCAFIRMLVREALDVFI